MSGNEEKKAENLKDMKIQGKEINKTAYGKFLIIVIILFCVITFIGLGISVFKAIIYFKGFDIDKYQPIIDLGNLCMNTGLDGIFYSGIFGICTLPVVTKYEKEYKNNNKTIMKLGVVSTSAIALGYLLSFIIDAVPIIVKIMTM